MEIRTQTDSDALDVLTDEIRGRIGALADVIVPASGNMKSATEAGVHTRYIDRALIARPDMIAPLLNVLAVTADLAGEDLERTLETIDDSILEPIVEFIIASYFMWPMARRAVNYAGQVATPILEGETEYYLEDNILGPVKDRGEIWRRVPEDSTV
nr:hypothetical protein [Rhodococcus sp. (in: high G+C Gram-positive bacteria)]